VQPNKAGTPNPMSAIRSSLFTMTSANRLEQRRDVDDPQHETSDPET
jgi:hypothetical protein